MQKLHACIYIYAVAFSFLSLTKNSDIGQSLEFNEFRRKKYSCCTTILRWISRWRQRKCKFLSEVLEFTDASVVKLASNLDNVDCCSELLFIGRRRNLLAEWNFSPSWLRTRRVAECNRLKRANSSLIMSNVDRAICVCEPYFTFVAERPRQRRWKLR